MKTRFWLPLLALCAASCDSEDMPNVFSLHDNNCTLIVDNGTLTPIPNITLLSSYNWTASVSESLKSLISISATQGEAGVSTIRLTPSDQILSAYNPAKPHLGSIFFHAQGLSLEYKIFLYGSGDGTPAAPFIIATPEQMDKLREDMGAHYLLIADLVLKNWVPIESFDAIPSVFVGKLNGNGHKITIQSFGTVPPTTSGGRTQYRYGLFGNIGNGGKVHDLNVHIDNITVTLPDGASTAWGLFGGITAYIEAGNGSIERCAVTGSINLNWEGDQNAYAGGIAAWNNGGAIQDVYTTATVETTSLPSSAFYSAYVGGIVGYHDGSITRAYATGKIKALNGSYNHAGGIAGYSVNAGLITACVALNTEVVASGGMGQNFHHRIIGYGNNAKLENHYASDQMKDAQGSTTAWDRIGLNKWSGESISQNQWSSKTWWTNTANWGSYPWDFTNTWTFSDGYPRLKGPL